MVFEYDANKSAENKRQHGIDFEGVPKNVGGPGGDGNSRPYIGLTSLVVDWENR
jgi:hypothetical protein